MDSVPNWIKREPAGWADLWKALFVQARKRDREHQRYLRRKTAEQDSRASVDAEMEVTSVSES